MAPQPLIEKGFEVIPHDPEGTAFWEKDIRSACEFYMRYKDNPEDLFEEQRQLLQDINYLDNIKALIDELNELEKDMNNDLFITHLESYNEWLFKYSFKDVMEDEN